MYFLYILAAIVFLLALFALIPITAEINYEYINKAQRLTLVIKLFKHIKIKIPVNLKKGVKKAEKEAEKEVKKADISFKKAKNFFFSIKNAFSDSKNDIYKILYSLKKNIIINHILFEMEYGLSNAAKTGIANGVIWAAATGALSAVDNISEIKSSKLNIYPVFDRQCFNVRFSGILTFKIVHIITVGIKILKLVNYFAKNLNNQT